MVKEVKREHVTKDDQCEADVILIDNSEVKPGSLAVAVIGVFGKEKIQLLKQHLGEPMVFFNLSITVYKGSTDIKHYADEVVTRPPVCSKTAALTNKKTVLAAATNTVEEFLEKHAGAAPLPCARFFKSCGKIGESVADYLRTELKREAGKSSKNPHGFENTKNEDYEISLEKCSLDVEKRVWR